jgi:hypothetical protein
MLTPPPLLRQRLARHHVRKRRVDTTVNSEVRLEIGLPLWRQMADMLRLPQIFLRCFKFHHLVCLCHVPEQAVHRLPHLAWHSMY